ncbi:alanine racemase [Nocardioides panacis]|uniref:Alanine racemase n=1 Tax=Nocardioides panacis TaxID=2849501 RepID=A0A975SZ81_9ACTN|nr:alanine racemase [Nocardioides panacis]QWZ08606.1 alanine racemase [Nocardioides panacis]
MSALEHNIATMARYCRDHGVDLYPHGKTTMAPQVVAAQLDAGSAGVTVATVAQLRVFQAHGLGPGLVANQVVDEAGASWLGRTLADHGQVAASCYVDSVEGATRLDRLVAAARGAGTTARLGVLVELGHADGRTGARTLHQAQQVAEAVAASKALELVGVAGYEGSLVRETPSEAARAAREFCLGLGDLAGRLLARGLLPERPMVSAGGSAYFDAVVDALAGEDAWRLVLRSGCYVTHDHGLYHDLSPFERSDEGYTLRPALQVFAPVLSRPEDGTVVIGAGRRDASSDGALPVVLAARRGDRQLDVRGVRTLRLFDQHLVAATPSSGCELEPGDEVQLGISHPCTTFDKWRWIPVVDDDDRIVDVLRTFF